MSVKTVATVSIAALGVAITSLHAGEQSAYPNKPIKIIAPVQPGGVLGFEQVHDSGHFMDRIAAQFRPGAMRGLAARLKLQP